MVVVFFMIRGCMVAVSGCRHFQEDEREECKYQSLDESHEELESQKGNRREVGQQKTDDQQQHFTGENIPEQTEGEGNDLRALRNQLQYPNERSDGIPPR